MAKVQTDKYANVMIGSVTESAANTLTFAELPQVTTLLEKKAFLINRIQYNAYLSLLVADTDNLDFGLSLSNRWTSPSLIEPSIIDYQSRRLVASGAPATALLEDNQVIQDWSTLPGGGMLVPTRPLFLWTKGTALASASAIIVKIYFTVIDLTPADYWDLVESLQAYT